MLPENGYYPPGTENDPNAPWNESPEPDEVEVEVMASYSMSKTYTINTNDYISTIENTYDVDIDENGNKYVTGNTFEFRDFSDTNWEKAFEEDSNVLGIPELLDILSKLADEKIYFYELRLKEATIPEKRKLINNLRKRWQNIKQSCKGWTVDEFIVEQE